MFETSYSDSYGRRLRVHHEYGRLTLATAGLLYVVGLDQTKVLRSPMDRTETVEFRTFYWSLLVVPVELGRIGAAYGCHS